MAQQTLKKDDWLTRDAFSQLLKGRATFTRRLLIEWLYKSMPKVMDSTVYTTADRLIARFKRDGLIETEKPGIYKIISTPTI